MKKYIIISILCISILTIVFSQAIFAKKNAWKYSIRPDTSEWKMLDTMEKIINTQQIPEDTLKAMTTQEVFEAWMDLPGRLEVLAFNSIQEGIDETAKRYNVLRELLQRKDAGEIILSYYGSINPEDVATKENDLDKGKFITDMAFVEIILSQTQIINSMKDKKKIVNTTLEKINEKEKLTNKGIVDDFWEDTGVILIGRILMEDNKTLYSDDEIKKSLKNGEFSPDNANRKKHINQIIEDGKRFVN